ncbi:MAG: ATP-binding protein, partial [Pseudomonadota bacterium]
FEALPVPMLRIGSDGDVQMLNRLARDLLGDAVKPGTPLATLVEGLGRSVSDWLADALEGRGINRTEVVRRTNAAQDIYLQVTLSRVDSDGDPGLVAVLNDATELKTLEAQFVQSQKMQAIGQLAGGVAHDFNNLLTAISGHCDLLLLRHDEGDQDYGDLIQINQNANRAASLVGQLLAFSRKQNLQPRVLDMRDMLADLTHLLNRLVGEKVTLNLLHDPALKMVRADKRQLEQVLMNLVVNARDAMPDGGIIEIQTRQETLATELTRDRAIVPPGEYVVVRVRDQGIGIAPEVLAKIFEPFYTTKKTGDGTGLGLSTAYGIIKQTGGFIFCDSVKGSGTTFSLYFPAHEREATRPIVSERKDDAPSAPAREEGVVLLVEDEAPVRAFASRALRMRGYTVLEAENAEEALETLKDDTLDVDVFVTDVIMPGMDGPTWVRKALEDRPGTNVVFVSGYAEEHVADNQSRIPNSVFLPKPFSLSELTAMVQRQLH